MSAEAPHLDVQYAKHPQIPGHSYQVVKCHPSGKVEILKHCRRQAFAVDEAHELAEALGLECVAEHVQ